MVTKTRTELEFEKDSRKLFQNNTHQYSDSDISFLRTMNRAFGNALSAKGLNLLDPIHANFFHYNKLSMRGNADYPRVSRTYIFFTRPELNFSFENINAIPFFKWLHSKRIGKMIMASLTDPEYFINAPSAMNSLSSLSANQLRDVMNSYEEAIRGLERDIRGQDPEFADAASEKPASYEIVEATDKQSDSKALEAMTLEELNDKDSLDLLSSKIGRVKNFYDTMEEHNTALETNMIKLWKQAGGKHSASDEKDIPSYRTYLSQHYKLAKDLLREDDRNKIEKFAFTTPFIPLLGNTCVQCTGAKGFNLESHQYEDDRFGGNLNVATGMDGTFSSGTLTTTFEDIYYNPVSLMMMVWVLYIHYVSRGYITTTREHIIERILDYTCSIYIFVIGEDGRRIERWGKFTGCYPTSFPMDAQLEHNLNIDQDILHKISISWNFNRYEPMNPEIFTDFNFLSESEWLVKLKDALWENAYNRFANINNMDFLDLKEGNKRSEAELMMLRTINRSSKLWEVVKPEDIGMSGKLPAALINGDTTGLINNYWGGYPYIVNGTDFIWVMPSWTKRDGSSADIFFDNKGKRVITTEGNKNNSPELHKEDKIDLVTVNPNKYDPEKSYSGGGTSSINSGFNNKNAKASEIIMNN